MVNVKVMCRPHLLGEHHECHMLAGSLRLEKNITGFVDNNLLEPKSLKKRHDELVQEMKRRGYNHNSPLEEVNIDYLPISQQNTVVDVKKAEKELFSRCIVCRVNNLLYSTEHGFGGANYPQNPPPVNKKTLKGVKI